MRKLSEGVEAALHICVLVAAAAEDAGLPASQLASFHELAPQSTAKQLQRLAAAGILAGSTGRVGGYQLAKAPAEVTVLDIVVAINGHEPLFKCREIRRKGPCSGKGRRYSARCAIASVMDRADVAWRDVLRQVTLADLCANICADADPRTLTETRRWLSSHKREVRE